MVLFLSCPPPLSHNDLHVIRDACVALLGLVDADSTTTWWTCVKHYRCITPRTVDELSPPGTDTEDATDTNTIVVIQTSTAANGIENKLVSSKMNAIVINGDISEFMEKCFPDYRLRAEMRAQGWSINGGEQVVRGGLITMGSQPVGLCLECDDAGPLRPLISDHFTPAQSTTIGDHLWLVSGNSSSISTGNSNNRVNTV